MPKPATGAKDRRAAPKPDELAPVDWPAIEPHFKAGIRTMSSLEREFGVSRAGIAKHAKKHGWERALCQAIHDKADRLVSAQAAKESGPKKRGPKPKKLSPPIPDDQIIDEAARQLASVRLSHRTDIAALRRVVTGLMAELALTMDAPEVFGQAYDALQASEDVPLAALEDMARLVQSLPSRTKVAKDLSDALFRCIGMEREAHGLDTAGGTDGRPVVIIKDYTGRGDPDAPARRAA